MYTPRLCRNDAAFCWLHSWWWFRAQTSALQQATPFLGAANRDAATVPPMAIRRNTSTLNGRFNGNRRFTSSVISADAPKWKGYCAKLRQRMVPRYRRASTFGSAANALDGSERSMEIDGGLIVRRHNLFYIPLTLLHFR